MKYTWIIDYEKDYQRQAEDLGDLIAVIGLQEDDIKEIEKDGGEGFIDSTTDVIVDVFGNFYDVNPLGIYISSSAMFSTLSEAESKLIIEIFTNYKS